MNQKAPVQYVLGALGDIAGSALFRNAMKYWWVTLPIGYAAYASVRSRMKGKTLTPLGVVGDVAPAVSLVATLVMLNHTLEQRDQRTAAAVVSSIPPAGIKDASFTASKAS